MIVKYNSIWMFFYSINTVKSKLELSKNNSTLLFTVKDWFGNEYQISLLDIKKKLTNEAEYNEACDRFKIEKTKFSITTLGMLLENKLYSNNERIALINIFNSGYRFTPEYKMNDALS